MDTVLVLDVTPNRADCLSLLGVAREIGRSPGARLRPAARATPRAGRAGLERGEGRDRRARRLQRILRARRARREARTIAARHAPAAPSSGHATINNVVDATNYVMLELGQPLHAFDLARVRDGRIVVRRATASEPFTTLDGVARTLEATDLVIADGGGPVALAGVMGGQESEVGPETASLLLESAFFRPASVRRTARRLGLLSQAAYRFERRVDPEQVEPALDAAAALIARLAKGAVAPGVVIARGARADEPRAIRFRPARAASLLGVAAAKAESTRRLRALGAACSGDGAVLVVAPPSHRGDLQIEEDLVEEIARLGGYATIPTTVPSAPVQAGADSPSRILSRRIRRCSPPKGSPRW
jgi:phenylalanyl-tRNA synthetase beta chain